MKISKGQISWIASMVANEGIIETLAELLGVQTRIIRSVVESQAAQLLRTMFGDEQEIEVPPPWTIYDISRVLAYQLARRVLYERGQAAKISTLPAHYNLDVYFPPEVILRLEPFKSWIRLSKDWDELFKEAAPPPEPEEVPEAQPPTAPEPVQPEPAPAPEEPTPPAEEPEPVEQPEPPASC